MPGADRAGVVLAQRLGVPDLQPRLLQQRHRLAQRPHVHVRGDVRLDERPAARSAGAARHLLHQHPPGRPHQPVQGGGERRVLGVTDVLAHLDRGDGVVRAALAVPVVLAHHPHPFAQAALAHPLADVRRLFPGQRDGGDLCPVPFGGVQGERAPAAADVQQPGAGHEVQLAADQLQLGPLGVGGGEAGLLARPVAAGVGHGLVEEQGVEVVGQVVVVADGGPVAGPAVQAAAQPRLGGGSGRRRAHDPEAYGRGERAGPVGGREPRRARAPLAGGRPHRPQALGEVALDVDLAGHVGLREAQLAGLPQQAAQGAAGAQDDHGGAGRAGLAAVPGAQPQGQRAAEDVPREGGEPVGRAGPGGGAGGGGHRAGFSLVNRYCWTSR